MRVVSGFSPSGYIQYGNNFLRTFDQFWPESIELQVFTEETVPMPRGECFSVLEIPGCREFIEKHSKIPSHCGAEPLPAWKQKDIAAGYSYRYDAVKFCRQLFIPEAAADMLCDDEILVWLDGDVVSFAPVDPNMIEGMLGDADLCYLGRKGSHSELGFWAIRTNDRSRFFVKSLADLYRSEMIFKLGEWHSAYVFDQVRLSMKAYGLVTKDCTPGGSGHVWFVSPLGTCLDHLKGDRKDRGASVQRGTI